MDGSNNNLNNLNENQSAEVNTATESATEVHTEPAASVFEAAAAQASAPEANTATPQAGEQSYFSYQNVSAPTVESEEANSKSTTAMVLGIIAIVSSCICCCLPVCVVLAIISFVFAVKSKKLSVNNKLNGKAIAAIICSIVAIVIYVIVIAYMILVAIGFNEIINNPELYAEFERELAEYGYEIELN